MKNCMRLDSVWVEFAIAWYNLESLLNGMIL